MTTFKEIRGKLIRTLDTDPTPTSTYEGQIWYNKTIGVLKGATYISGTWASGGTRGTPRSLSASAGATVSANLSFGGYLNPTFQQSTATEEYNGTAWTAGGAINSPLGVDSSGGCGTQTAALSATGKSGPQYGPFPPITNSFEYDGSTWTSGGSVSLGRTVSLSSGIQTAALIAGGQPASPPGTNTTEEYNGSAWTAGGNLPQVIYRGTGTGTQTATIQAGGHQDNPTSTDLNVTNYYDGTSWTAQTTINTARNALGSAGIQTSAVIYGGYQYTNPPVGNSAATETWDGTSWTTETPVPTASSTSLSPTSISASEALALTGPATTAEWTGPSFATKTLTTS